MKTTSNDQIYVPTQYINNFSKEEIYLFCNEPEFFKERYYDPEAFWKLNYLFENDERIQKTFLKVPGVKKEAIEHNLALFEQKKLGVTTIRDKIMQLSKGVWEWIVASDNSSIVINNESLRKEEMLAKKSITPAFTNLRLVFILVFFSFSMGQALYNSLNKIDSIKWNRPEQSLTKSDNHGFISWSLSDLDDIILSNKMLKAQIMNNTINEYLIIFNLVFCIGLCINFIVTLKAKEKNNFYLAYIINMILVSFTMFINWIYFYLKSIHLRKPNAFSGIEPQSLLPEMSYGIVIIIGVYTVFLIGIFIIKFTKLSLKEDNNE